MKKSLALLLVCFTTLSCQEPKSTPDNPCYKCQIAETYRGVTSSSYWDRCGDASVANFIQRNTNRQSIIQGDSTYVLSRITTCVLK